MRAVVGFAVMAWALTNSAIAQQQCIAFRNVRVFDGLKTVERATVVIRNGKIEAIGAEVVAPSEAQIVEGSGRTLLPGLIDTHVHITKLANLEQALTFGVTTVLNMSGSVDKIKEFRQRQTELGPSRLADFLTTSHLATRPKGHGTEYGHQIPTIDNPADAEDFVDARIAEGASWIKIIYEAGGPRGVSNEVLVALVAAAHKRAKLALVHTMGGSHAAQDVLEAGGDVIIHPLILRESPANLVERNLVERMVRQKVALVPTLSVFEPARMAVERAALAAEPDMAAHLSPADQEKLRRPAGNFNIEAALKSIARCQQSGVTILVGSDPPGAGVLYGPNTHREMELLARTIGPTAALAGATGLAAKVFQLPDRGQIAPGLRADLLLVEGDPTADITATRRIVGVWHQGQAVERKATKTMRTEKSNSQGRK